MKKILYLILILQTINILPNYFIANSTEVPHPTNPKIPFGSDLQNKQICTRMEYCGGESDYIRAEPNSDEFSENYLVCICTR